MVRMSAQFRFFFPLLFCFLLLILFPSNVFGQTESFSDTLIVRNSCVIFYQCSKAEYDSLFEQMTFSLDSIVHNFEEVRDKIIPYLKKTGLPYLSTTASVMLLFGDEITQYNRKPFFDLTGIILFAPNKKPKVLQSVKSDVPIFGEIRKYFGQR
jgi:hypothetical protein